MFIDPTAARSVTRRDALGAALAAAGGALAAGSADGAEAKPTRAAAPQALRHEEVDQPLGVSLPRAA